VRIDDIKPYGRNPRRNEKAVPVVAESIKEFGLKGQIVLESRLNPVIVAGHSRWAACRSLGWEEIPDERIDYCEDLTEEQVRAYRLADNRTGEIAVWNKAMLRSEAAAIKSRSAIDMGRFAFDFKGASLPHGAERLRTDRGYNLGMIAAADCARDGYPRLSACRKAPERLLGFNFAKTSDDTGAGLHFFLDDYQFERVWASPDRYLGLLGRFACALTPDFSLYADMPLPMQQWNVYRSLALGKYWQRNGISVVPSLQWAGKATFAFCFKGVPKDATVAASTVGVKREKESIRLWCAGMAEAMRQCRPRCILLYGGNIGFDFGGTKVIEYQNEVTERMNNGR
jgi:hypothetical protein